jgi:hypothetical protein
VASDDEVPGAAAEPRRTSHRSLGGLPGAVIVEERSERRGTKHWKRKKEKGKRKKKKRFLEADQAVSRIEMNGRLISALLGLFAQPKPRPIFCAAHPPCSAPGAISNGTISLHDRAVSPSMIGSSRLSSYIAALSPVQCDWLSTRTTCTPRSSIDTASETANCTTISRALRYYHCQTYLSSAESLWHHYCLD